MLTVARVAEAFGWQVMASETLWPGSGGTGRATAGPRYECPAKRGSPKSEPFPASVAAGQCAEDHKADESEADGEKRLGNEPAGPAENVGVPVGVLGHENAVWPEPFQTVPAAVSTIGLPELELARRFEREVVHAVAFLALLTSECRATREGFRAASSGKQLVEALVEETAILGVDALFVVIAKAIDQKLAIEPGHIFSSGRDDSLQERKDLFIER